MSRRTGGQTDLAAALDTLMRRLDKGSGGGYVQSRVSLAWERVAGPSALEHTTGAHVRDGELLVYVDSPVWATQLSALSERYRVALNEEIGQEAVSTVRFAVSRKVQDKRRLEEEQNEAEEFYSEDKVEPVPLTETERAQVEASVMQIADEELREAVLRATVADLEWKKGIAGRLGREAAPDGS